MLTCTSPLPYTEECTDVEESQEILASVCTGD
jgi:hypothetical protein